MLIPSLYVNISFLVDDILMENTIFLKENHSIIMMLQPITSTTYSNRSFIIFSYSLSTKSSRVRRAGKP